MTQRPTEFVVKRSTWLRGGNGDPYLLDERGHMCCLGFVSAQRGVPAAALLNRSAPARVDWTQRHQLRDLLVIGERQHTKLANEAVELNDSADYSEAEREELLTMLFARHGYALRFEP